MDNYEILEQIGNGAYGEVYRAIMKSNEEVVALKKIKLKKYNLNLEPLDREIGLLELLKNSRYVVRLISVECVDARGNPVPRSQIGSQGSVYLVLEFMDSDLNKILDSGSLTAFEIQSFLYQICKGLAYCHEENVLHRDLKPHNLLINREEGLLKIADFGSSRPGSLSIYEVGYTDGIGTFWYMAPEIVLGSTSYSKAIDIWSVGCIFAQMVTRSVLFRSNQTGGDQLIQIFRQLGTPNETNWPGVEDLPYWKLIAPLTEYPAKDLAEAVPHLDVQGRDLLAKMLSLNPADRISAADAMNHPYFDSLDKDSYNC